MIRCVEVPPGRVIILPIVYSRELIMIAEILNLQKLQLGVGDVDDDAFERNDLAVFVGNAVFGRYGNFR